MKTKLLIGAALFAALSNTAIADNDIDLRGPVGYRDFFEIVGYSLKPQSKIMDLVVISRLNCKEMVVMFGAEKDGIIERVGGYIELRDAEVGRKYRQTMITDLQPGGILSIKSMQCRNGVGSLRSWNAKDGFRSFGR